MCACSAEVQSEKCNWRAKKLVQMEDSILAKVEELVTQSPPPTAALLAYLSRIDENEHYNANSQGLSICTIYILLLFCEGKVVEAVHYFRRMGTVFAKDGEVAGILGRVGRALREKDFASTIRVLNGTKLGAPYTQLQELLLTKCQEKLFRLVGSVYSSIQVNVLSSKMEIAPDQVVEICRSYGWPIDTAAGVVFPAQNDANSTGNSFTSNEATAAGMELLTKSILNFERAPIEVDVKGTGRGKGKSK